MARKDQKVSLSPAEQALYDHPIYGPAIRSGQQIDAGALDKALQDQLGVGSGQQVGLNPALIQDYQQEQAQFNAQDKANLIDRVTGQVKSGLQIPGVTNVPNVPGVNMSPIKSIKDILSPNMINPQGRPYNVHTVTPSTAPTSEVNQTASPFSGISDILTQINNLISGQTNKGVTNPILAGPGGLSDVLSQGTPIGSVDVNTATGTGTRTNPKIDLANPLDPTGVLSRLFTPEGRGITSSQILGALHNILPQSTNKIDENKILEAAKQQYPDLAKTTGLTAEKGLKKYSGAGIIKVGGNKYKIQGSKIVKVG